MISLDTTEVARVQNRYPDVFKSNPVKRFAPILAALGLLMYGAYVWSFFSIGDTIAKANWEIAGNYLADWVAYEVRPDIEMQGNYLEVVFPKFSPLGKNPQVDWIENDIKRVTKTVVSETSTATQNAENKTASSSLMAPAAPATSGGFMASNAATGDAQNATAQNATTTISEDAIVHSIVHIGDAVINVTPGRAVITRGAETVDLTVDIGNSVTPAGALPAWARQKRVGGKVVMKFGFAGRVEVDDDEVKVRHRFLGWENFLFDTRSQFWGLPLGEVAGLIFNGEELEPGTSNLSLAFDDILNNAEWQHGDVWIKLLQTVVMAFVGTLFASIVAFPLAFGAARNITRNKFVNQLLKRSFDFLRSVDMLIWALVFTRTFGPGPLAGMSAIFFTDTGTFGKLYSETLENIDDKQREGVKSVGANPILVQRYGVVPQVLPVFLSQSLYFWESNTRSATIIGAVGAGGIGLKLWEAMRTNADWENVAYMVLLILIVVFIFDNISNVLRSKLIGKAGH